ncbi:DEAD/DEAH box helicase [Glycomyces salinus]|uniref:DEAD/DEAH box helicase n=1 Tax=Glycomyces salinus TaxID=980294 RepID=UPI0018EE16FB|nr:DEAD/DEAH box helicase [Glycomyces salinus]
MHESDTHPENPETPETAQAVEAPEVPEAEEITVETDDVKAADQATFEDLGLPAKITAALAEQGIEVPFPIQAATIPDALAGRDVLGRGRTGSGKTLAFGLPALARLASGGRTRPGKPRAVILSPTRELAIQIADALQSFGDAVGIEMKVVCGGTAFSRQIDALRSGVDMLVATPGRLRDLIRRGDCSLEDVELAVLDEADQMADMGFLPEVEELFDMLPEGGQRMLFSATLEKEIDVLVRKYLSDPVQHSVDPSSSSVTTMSHHLLLIGPRDKQTMTAAIAARPGLTMVFVRTQLAVDRIAEELRDAGVNAEGLHGGMTQGDRSRVLDQFKRGHLEALVCTDVAARGIHVDGVDVVLHVDPPKTHKDYLHRAGRTARAGESGVVATLVLPHQNRTVFSLIERAGVDAKRHFVNDNFDPELAELLGARNFTDMRAARADHQATRNEAEIGNLERKIQRLREDVEGLRAEAGRLREQAEREIIEGPSKRSRDRGPRRDRDGYRGGDRRGGGGGGYKGGRGFRGDRDDRGGRGSRGDRDDRGGRGYKGDRDDRGFRGNRDDRGGRDFRSRDDRGDRGGRGGFRGDRDNRSGGYRGTREDRGGRDFRSRDARGDRGGRGGFRGDRDNRSGGYRGNRDDRGGRDFRSRDDRGDRGGRGGFRGDRDNRSGGDRGNRDDRGGRDFRSRDARGDRGGRGGFRGDRDNRGDRGGFRGNSDRRERW